MYRVGYELYGCNGEIFSNFSCGIDYRGDYCEYDNPCRPDLNRCMHGGVCNIILNEAGVPADARCECALGLYNFIFYSIIISTISPILCMKHIFFSHEMLHFCTYLTIVK